MNMRQDINLKQLSASLQDGVGALKLNVVEAIFLLAAIGFASFVGYFYVSEVQPLNSQIAELRAQRDAVLQKSAQDKKHQEELEKQRANAEGILNSLVRFEASLRNGQTGKAALIDEFEALAAKHKIVTGDFGFKPLDAESLLDEQGQPLKDVIKNERINVYPALGLETAVIGDYPNLRRFMADLEKSRQFLIINAVTFQGEADKSRVAAAASKGRMPQLDDPNSIPVTLKIEMDTFFKQQ
jgi:hypothetical protein